MLHTLDKPLSDCIHCIAAYASRVPYDEDPDTSRLLLRPHPVLVPEPPAALTRLYMQSMRMGEDTRHFTTEQLFYAHEAWSIYYFLTFRKDPPYHKSPFRSPALDETLRERRMASAHQSLYVPSAQEIMQGATPAPSLEGGHQPRPYYSSSS